ncbi:Trehalose synthase [Cystobacter fuscus DSM 2262]|uniref:Trehalose synthase n=1 Tax=Cystobacter fuscus (strain ATCC 25194 / DSM 2262 / NBRC 100088 / M29) TaxID=1242864 RepID=S9PF00_CYSF2|nr:alpha-amylase family protein [Cystobacter fuscus]EPX60947.1 Trehalose synthase [Cystobacter fuscus DSM 2262]
MIDDLWYKNAIIYCLDVKTFMDSNGDGVGDFEGLTRRLGYLAGMGINALWLLPFNTSPMRDNGYDISDFYGIQPSLGSLGDFVDFTHEAKKHGIRVLMDLVVNHTSDQHPWFKSAVSDPRSRYRDWYLWSKTKPAGADEGMVFPGVQKTTWTRHPKAREYYFHRFYEFQPDLNTSHPDVQEEIRRIAGFWLELGVSGFRMDAVPFVIQRDGARASHDLHYQMLHDLRTFLQWRAGDAILLAEANVVPKRNVDYFGDEGDRMHMMFNFLVNQNAFLALASADTRPLVKALESTRITTETSQWAHFMRNNDELDLGRLTEPQRQLVFEEFGPEPRMQVYERGLRRRLAPMFSGDRRRQELAYSLMFTLPGTPVLRYGDEIGMGEDLSLKERAAVRTPMQWSTERNAGFSSARKTFLPVISEGPFGYPRVNVADQRRDPNSLLNWTERIIRARKECPEIGWGTWRVLKTGSPQVLALRYDWRNNAVVFLHNFDAKSRTVTFGAGSEDGKLLANLLSGDSSQSDGRGQHRVELEGYGYRWFRVGGLDYIQRRTK